VPVRRISEGVGTGEVRQGNSYDCSVPAYSMNLLHCPNDIYKVLDDVIRVALIK